MRLEHIMRTHVETVLPTDSAEAAWQKMQKFHIHHLVVASGDRVAGIVSDADLGGRHGAPIREGRTVSQLMTPYIVSARPSMSLGQAARMLRGRAISCLPVLEDGMLVGIITISDLLDHLSHLPNADSGSFAPLVGVPPANTGPVSA
jgi:acetoin utilization protein AcuB